MNTIAVSELTEAEVLGLVRACLDVDGGPQKGIHVGRGRHVAMPGAITEEDMASGDPARTIGWTFHGPQHGEFQIPVNLSERINGTEGAELVRSPAVLALARAALAKSKHLETDIIATKDTKT